MAQPITQKELPAGVVRSSFGGRVVLLVDSKMPFSQNKELLKLADTMLLTDRILRYWVFSVVQGAFDRNAETLTITLPNPHLVKSAGYNTYEGAEAKYEEWACSDANKSSIKMGINWIIDRNKKED